MAKQRERLCASNQSQADAERIAEGLSNNGQPARIQRQPNQKFSVWAYPAPSQPMFTRPTDSLSKRSSGAKASNEAEPERKPQKAKGETQVKKSKPGDWRKK